MQTLLEQQLGKLYTTVSCNCSYRFSLLGCLMNRFNFYLLKNGSPRQYTSTNGSTEMKENIKSYGCTGQTMITTSGQISAKAWAVKGLVSQQSTTQGWFRLLLKITTQDMCRLWARQTEVSKVQCLTGKYEWKEDGHLSLRRFKDSIGVWTEFAQWWWSLESRNDTIPETELQEDNCGHWKWGWIVARESCGRAWLGRCSTS